MATYLPNIEMISEEHRVQIETHNKTLGNYVQLKPTNDYPGETKPRY